MWHVTKADSSSPEVNLDFMKTSSLVLLMSMLLLSTVSAAGCTSNVTPSPYATATTTLPALQLERAMWILASLATETGMNNSLPNTTITATFEDGNVTGSSGCNRYFGSYQLCLLYT